ncbi:nuclear transport factor 2 family protein [Actinoallomurus sp. NPDC050550]|uniref:nuclear transport factor 2 family protein n=1 Tax=Actinoallomurus sp. NPDC050550 TaxID=3154937 RepID=UPI0033FF2D9B
MDREQAVALLHRLHTAQNAFYGGGDAAALREILTEDIAWHVPGNNAIAGDHHGVEAVLAYFRRRRELADRSFRMHTRDVLSGDGEWITALTDGTATIAGEEHTWSTVGLYRVRDGRIAGCRMLPHDQAAFDAIWAHRSPPADAGAVPVSVYHARIRPRHCDAQGVLHATRYYEYFEDAFLGWLDDHVGGYQALRAAGADLVVVASGCEHRRGPQLDDPVSIEVRPTGAGRSSLAVSFVLRRDDDVSARGHITYVAVSDGASVPLPAGLRAIVRAVPPIRRRQEP